jgi:hypothetical protein
MDHADANYISNWNDHTVSNVSYPLMNQKMFESPKAPIGPHTLKVSYTADSTSPGLGFDYLIVTNVTLPPRPSGTPSHAKGKPRGAIAGGVIGGVVCLGIAVLVIYFYRRRLNSKRRIEAGRDEPIPFDQRPARFALSPRAHPVQRKSRMFPIHSHSDTNPANLSLSGTSQMHPTGKPSVTNGLEAHHTGHLGLQPQPTPPSAQQDVPIEVDIAQANPSQQPESSPWTPGSRVVVHQDSGIRYGGASARPMSNLPPEYTPD